MAKCKICDENRAWVANDMVCDDCWGTNMRLNRANLKALTHFGKRIEVLKKEKGE